MASPTSTDGAIRSLIPARIDRLPWSSFHTRMVIALGVAWILDGLEITIASAVADTLSQPETLGLSSAAVGLLATVYLAGEVVGALFFGRLSDKLGRRNLFMVTLGVYLLGSALTALTLGNGAGWVAFLYVTRFIAGMGIGGEYAAINSAIDELIPARYRGRVDIAVNGTYWAGAVLGTLGTFVFLKAMDLSVGWRLAFLIGPVLGLVILVVRRHLPESPRWQVMNGREAAAEESISYIEREVKATGASLPPVDESKAIELRPTEKIGYLALTRVLFRQYPSRSILGASLMISQSFLYNAIFFTYTLVLGKFYGVPSESTPLYLIAFAVGNLAGPLTIGHFFDTIGRRKMIAGTYILSGLLLAFSAVLFNAGALNALTQTIAWCVIFFFASAGASSAYLTVSEIFPLEVRAKAIAVFFAIAQCFGALGPVIYGALIGDGSEPFRLFLGYLLGAAVMIAGGLVAWFLAVDAEGKSLEDIATPLSAEQAPRRRGSVRAEGAQLPRSP
ncbi:MFS transporter [Mycolicibacterium chubuense]|uniref:Major myo-inositol transporter IolT n=1 Tax=Mycolicibacterium chubuense TaxID=1800 RepID=A0A0J6VWJ3_MYCCU|nr:MFS transporter [Mycolicibacterium chubuense]KMO73858.1 Major myo-inositol transporter IolT [Mycolicibacterium chubuense]ORA54962.1 MFS transporter [Mycolicibacterium chubuense]SPX97660.1 arabinose efflux permease family protein [Mycolicibacterium chubuense]